MPICMQSNCDQTQFGTTLIWQFMRKLTDCQHRQSMCQNCIANTGSQQAATLQQHGNTYDVTPEQSAQDCLELLCCYPVGHERSVLLAVAEVRLPESA